MPLALLAPVQQYLHQMVDDPTCGFIFLESDVMEAALEA